MNKEEFVEDNQLTQEATQGNDEDQAAEGISGRQELSDDELEQVSGGTIRKKDMFYCCYCNTRHVLFRYYPWKLRPAGGKIWYSNATKYVCESNGTFFTLPLRSGNTAYFNAEGRLLQ